MNPIQDDDSRAFGDGTSINLSRESWKIFQVVAEFVDGFENLAGNHPSVSMFGSARVRAGHPDDPGGILKTIFDFYRDRGSRTTEDDIERRPDL